MGYPCLLERDKDMSETIPFGRSLAQYLVLQDGGGCYIRISVNATTQEDLKLSAHIQRFQSTRFCS